MRVDLEWGENTRDGKTHTELHAPCGCAFHPVPSPHWHTCIDHAEIFQQTEIRREHRRELEEEVQHRLYWQRQAVRLAHLVGDVSGKNFGDGANKHRLVNDAIGHMKTLWPDRERA